MSENDPISMETRIAQACHYLDETTGAVNPAIPLSSTFARDTDYELVGEYSYGRSGHPGWAVLEKVAAELDGGADALCAKGVSKLDKVWVVQVGGDDTLAIEVFLHLLHITILIVVEDNSNEADFLLNRCG